MNLKNKLLTTAILNAVKADPYSGILLATSYVGLLELTDSGNDLPDQLFKEIVGIVGGEYFEFIFATGIAATINNDLSITADDLKERVVKMCEARGYKPDSERLEEFVNIIKGFSYA